MNQESVQALLREIPRMREDLPFSPEMLKRLFEQTGGNSMASLEEVGSTLSRDQGLTTRILSMANSAYYGLQAEVTSVNRAAAVLGMKEIRNIVLALGVRELSGKHGLPEEFDLQAYWTHQFFVAMICRELSRLIDVGVPDNLFTAGMLHDIGKLIIAMKRPGDWSVIQSLTEEQELTDAEAEDEHWGMDHAVIGALVLRTWDLPPDLVEPVNWHHAPDLSPAHSSESGLLCLADCAAHAAADPESPYAVRMESLCPDVGVEPQEIAELAEDLLDSEDIEQFASLLA